ncbi:hypothetical protein ABT369_52235 [Dactylosporangium sp. NPDC000244]|uniref:hypothetical protein n=1 Tax=Dactylosporangium sp. NPDC000244 TaxID=3154365 RepID=UPI00331F0F1E
MSGRVMVFAPVPVLTVTIERHTGRRDLHEELLTNGRAGYDSVPAFVDAARKLHAEGAEAVLLTRTHLEPLEAS